MCFCFFHRILTVQDRQWRWPIDLPQARLSVSLELTRPYIGAHEKQRLVMIGERTAPPAKQLWVVELTGSAVCDKDAPDGRASFKVLHMLAALSHFQAFSPLRIRIGAWFRGHLEL